MLRFLANIIGIAALLLGGLRLWLGFQAATIGDLEQREAFVSRYLGSGTSGDAIDGAIYTLLVGLVFLVLAKLLKRKPD